MTPGQTAAAMATICAAYPTWRATKHTAMLYESFLADVDPSMFAEAWARWILTETRAPMIAELRGAIADLSGQRVPDVDQAWAEVEAEIRRVGSYGIPSWSHPAVGEAVRSLGWGALCRSTEQGVDRGQFARHYQAAKRRAEVGRQDSAVLALSLSMHEVLEIGAPTHALPAKGKPARLAKGST